MLNRGLRIGDVSLLRDPEWRRILLRSMRLRVAFLLRRTRAHVLRNGIMPAARDSDRRSPMARATCIPFTGANHETVDDFAARDDVRSGHHRLRR
jgi:hypothetical protein